MAVRMKRRKEDLERLMDWRIKATTIKTPKTRTTRIHNPMIVIRNNKMAVAVAPVAIRITLQVPIQIPLIPRKKEIQNPKSRQNRRLLTLVAAAMAVPMAVMMITVPMTATAATPRNPLRSLKSKVHPVAAAALRA